MAKKWEEGIDYSVEIEKAKTQGLDTSALEAAREAKIKDKYGGNEPTMYGSNQTYKQASSGGNTSAIKNAVNTYNQYSGSTEDPYAGTDYHQNAIDAAMNGDWDAVMDALNKREEKVMAQGDNRGKTSAQIYAELMALYGQQTPEIPETPAFTGQKSSQIDSLLNAILNRDPFSYDHTTDPSYLAYEQQYKRLGDRAREDTLGDIAGLTGGYASSWAASAASQAQNDYNSQLSGKIPELYNAAYNRYLNEDSLMRDDLGILLGIDQTEYDRYRDTVSDSQWDKEFDYKVDRDKVSDSQWEQTFDWNKTVDQWNMSNTEATQKFDQMMTKWQMTGVADADVAAALGVPVGATTESYYFNKASLALDQAKLAQSAKEKDTTDPDAEYNKQAILANARNEMMKTGSYKDAAIYILSRATSANEFYALGAELGISQQMLNQVYTDFYNEATGEGNEPVNKDYLYYASLMGQQSDPEAWLLQNKWNIPADILEDLYNTLNY